ncbi:hypothetical protein RIR_jg623.t1 [Rhizophagus irregularis DAOM 181602=DAOM 197198]|nr:hypothetical protein RIR_jg623.t1 [Rhizophagus irregularis DAOM 181602=DAOM 197198]
MTKILAEHSWRPRHGIRFFFNYISAISGHSEVVITREKEQTFSALIPGGNRNRTFWRQFLKMPTLNFRMIGCISFIDSNNK